MGTVAIIAASVILSLIASVLLDTFIPPLFGGPPDKLARDVINARLDMIEGEAAKLRAQMEITRKDLYPDLELLFQRMEKLEGRIEVIADRVANMADDASEKT